MFKLGAISVRPAAFVIVLYSTLVVWVSSSSRLVEGRSRDDSPRAITLKKEVASLAAFSGNWSCQGVFPSSGKTIASKMFFAPDLEGAWLTVRHDDVPPNRYHAAEYWGYEPASQHFVAFFFDNFGDARKFASPGWNDKQWIWMGGTSKSAPQEMQRFVFRLDNRAQFVVSYEEKKGTADWLVGDSLTCRKS